MTEQVIDQVLERLRTKYKDVRFDKQWNGYEARCPCHEIYVGLFLDKSGNIQGCSSDCSVEQIKKALGETEAEKAAKANGVPAPKFSQFIMGKENPKPILENIMVALSMPDWDGLIAFDELALRPILRKPTPAHVSRKIKGTYPRQWEDSDDSVVTAYLQSDLALFIRPQQLPDAVLATAKRHAFHPILKYLANLKWDKKPRLDDWLHKYLGACDSPLIKAFAAKFVISAVARVRRPGSKVDHMLILEGGQGTKKSTALEALVPERDFFTDDLGDNLGKEAAERIAGKWIVEVSELDSMSKAEATKIKSFITRTTDRFRPAYGRWAVDSKRQCVFAGTTNTDEYLKDETGGRRFWPVQVGKIDLEGLRAVRDQLWGEASARYNAGETWWIEDESIIESARVEQRGRYQEDVWQEPIQNFIRLRSEVTVTEVLDAMKLETKYQDRSHQMRVSRTLKAIGWERHNIRRDGNRVWVYRPVPTVPTFTPSSNS